MKENKILSKKQRYEKLINDFNIIIDSRDFNEKKDFFKICTYSKKFLNYLIKLIEVIEYDIYMNEKLEKPSFRDIKEINVIYKSIKDSKKMINRYPYYNEKNICLSNLIW